MLTTDVKETVLEIVEQLVAHFRQRIHARVRTNRPKSIWIEEVVSKDPTTTAITPIPNIVQFWLDRLEAVSIAQARNGAVVVVENDNQDDEHRMAVILEWIRGYEESIRPFVFHPSRNNRLLIFRGESLSVLKHYEIVLSKLVSRYFNEQKRCGGTTTALQTLQRTIFLLTTDVTLLTATPPRNGSQDNNDDDQAEDNHLCKTEAIPTVLGLVDHTLAMVPPESNCEMLQVCLRHCAVTLMAFETASADGILASHHLAPSLSTSSHHGDTESTTTGLDVLQRMERELQNDQSAILRNYSDNYNDESFYSDLDDDAWNDMVRGQSSRVSALNWIDPKCDQILRSIWKRLEILSKPQTSKVPTNEQPYHEQRIAVVVEALGGVGPFFEEVRAHFFGRNMHGMEELLTTTNATPSVAVRMGKRVLVDATTPSEEPPHEVVCSRVAVAVNAMKLLLVPRTMGVGHRNALLANIFPVCATLVDSNRSALCALGVAGFVRTVDTLFWSDKESSYDDYDACESFADNTLSVLGRAFRSSSEPSVILAIGRAQSKILGRMVQQEESSRGSDRFRRQRRAVTGQWLLQLGKSMHRRTTKRQPLDFLLGGAIPLLAQHATDNDQEADGMEVGRLGLAALLPLIANTTPTMGIDVSEDFEEDNSNNDNVDPKTQLASIVALINLLFAAHPIMPGHGGKIISHLLAAALAVPPTNSNGNSSLNGTIRKLAIVAAALATIVCGPQFAGKLLESIESDRDEYGPELLAVVSEVRELAESLTTNS